MKVYDIFKSKQAREYVEVCKKRTQYSLKKQDEPPEFVERYKNALEAYRNLLDRRGFKMPNPKWEHIKDDKKTWAYSEVIEGNRNGVISIIKWVVNPEFAFKELL